MRIDRIEAIAYAAIGGRVVEPGPGLTIVHGPNESGKSSTMELLRGVLFGFPALDRRTSGPLREPKGGGQRSGRVDLTAADGRRYRIERTHGSRERATDLADGREVGGEELRRAIGIGSAALFDTVQTFDARDLARLDLLDDGEVRASVLASAVLGGGTGTQDVLAELARRADALYKPSGTNQPYAVQLKAVTEARKALREAERNAAGADRTDDALAEADARVAQTAAARDAAARELAELEALIEARDAVRDLDLVIADDVDEAPDPERISACRALAADLPVALDRRRRAEEARTEAALAERRGDDARDRLGLPADAPALADEATLRAAAQTTPSAPEARRGAGFAILAAGLLIAGIGMFAPAPYGGIAGLAGLALAALGAAVLVGFVAATRPTPTAGDWRSALAAVGIEAELRPDQLDDILAGFAALRAAEADATAARLRADDDDRAAAEVMAQAVALGFGDDLDGLRSAVDRALDDLEQGREAAQEHARRVATARERLERIDADADAARALDPADAEARRARLAEEVDAHAEEHAAALKEYGAIAGRLEDAAESADIPARALALAEAEAELRSTADRWLTLQVAHAIAQRARDRFIADHQPGVFARAGAQISTATGGSWVAIRMPDGERAGERSVIVDRDGDHTPFSELSAGTVGLVYLCLRAGLVDQLADEGGIELPVLMDDVLTDLDPERRAGAARVIADLATRHQVLYFTCHPEQVAALREADPGLREVVLERLV